MMKYKREQRIGRPEEKGIQCIENPRGKTIDKEIRSRRKLVLLLFMYKAQKAGSGPSDLRNSE
jgi:hypothetical protein